MSKRNFIILHLNLFLSYLTPPIILYLNLFYIFSSTTYYSSLEFILYLLFHHLLFFTLIYSLSSLPPPIILHFNLFFIFSSTTYYSSLEFILYLLFHHLFHNYFPHVFVQSILFLFLYPHVSFYTGCFYCDRNERYILLTQGSVLRRTLPSLLWYYQTLCPGRTVLGSVSESTRKPHSIKSVSKCKIQVTILLLVGRYAVPTVEYRVFGGVYYCYIHSQCCRPKRR